MGGVDYDADVGRTVQDAPRFGVNQVRVYDDVWLKAHPFYQVNKWIFDLPKGDPPSGMIGFGWHCWKPLLILDTLEIAKPGDVVGYVDGDTYPLRDLSPLYETAAREGGMFFDCSGRKHSDWCSSDCFVIMGQDDDRYWDALAGCARFLFVRKGDYRSLQLLYEWQTYCLHPYANTRRKGGEQTYVPQRRAGFQEHRTDQAILTNLAHKYGFPLYQEASQGSAHTPQYFEQVHRGHDTKNPGTGSRWRNV